MKRYVIDQKTFDALWAVLEAVYGSDGPGDIAPIDLMTNDRRAICNKALRLFGEAEEVEVQQ